MARTQYSEAYKAVMEFHAQFNEIPPSERGLAYWQAVTAERWELLKTYPEPFVRAMLANVVAELERQYFKAMRQKEGNK